MGTRGGLPRGRLGAGGPSSPASVVSSFEQEETFEKLIGSEEDCSLGDVHEQPWG